MSITEATFCLCYPVLKYRDKKEYTSCTIFIDRDGANLMRKSVPSVCIKTVDYIFEQVRKRVLKMCIRQMNS